MTDKYDEFGCDFKNEAECEEELDEEEIEFEKADATHFDDKKENVKRFEDEELEELEDLEDE